MKTLRLYNESINERYLKEAVNALEDGQLIIYPTDTIYAMGCDCLNNRAIEKLCRLKNINPEKNFLSVVCSDLSQASEYARIDNRAFRLLKQYLPGPFTFILPASTKLPKVFKGRKSVGIRIPDNTIARALAETLGRPVLSSSITNETIPDEDISAPSAIEMFFENRSDISVMIDGGTGHEEGSTIVDCTDSSAPEILRRGTGVFDY